MSVGTEIRTTPFHKMHVNAGAKMVPFAGYEMPVSYPLGIKKEHNHTRESAGLFDVSHMGQIRLSGEHAMSALESLVPVDIVDLPLMRTRYALFTTENGGVLDDLMVTNLGDNDLFLVVNAACKEADYDHLKNHLGASCEIEFYDDLALLALQGPKAAMVLSEFAPSVKEMTFMTAKQTMLNDIDCFITRSGYTGEDGYEISVSAKDAESLASSLLSSEEVEWIGLGARDSLRLEAGLSLYGHELDISHSPVESSLNWALSKARRLGGEREGNYLGSKVIMNQIENGSDTKVVGLIPEGRMPVRDGAIIQDENGNQIGYVTSGGFGPTLNKPISIARLETKFTNSHSKIFALVREKKIAVEIVKLPFVKHNYYRG
ncbi:glycine cleavage system aminomethyltransferase GcvT [Candidatus Thioglobus sp.]|nr:glycine cleavage system aminomethyltransferase GcvT [Candidatus Thioglobus sp.]